MRPYYEEVEVLSESFPDIDTDIDARPYAFVSGDASCGADDPFARGQVYQGNHMVEALLYRSAHTAGSSCYTTCYDSVRLQGRLSAVLLPASSRCAYLVVYIACKVPVVLAQG